MKCPKCKGTGFQPLHYHNPRECRRCDGTGSIPDPSVKRCATCGTPVEPATWYRLATGTLLCGACFAKLPPEDRV